MKKILFILILLTIVVSCTVPIENIDVKKGKEITSIYIQELPKDTVVISINNDKLYVFKDNIIEYEIKNIQTEKNDYIPMHIGIIMLWIVLTIFLIAGCIIYITD